MNYKTVPRKYRPVPFWSLNEKLNKDETSEQVRKMNEAGLGGCFMRARGGLQTEYMGDEWFENTHIIRDWYLAYGDDFVTVKTKIDFREKHLFGKYCRIGAFMLSAADF